MKNIDVNLNTANDSVELLNNYLEQSRIEINKMKRKVEEVHDMALRMYILAQFGKRLGLEDKSKNLHQTQFILKKQLRDLENILGVSIKEDNEQTDKLNELSEQVMEYIINTYGDVVEELVQEANTEQNIRSLYSTKDKDDESDVAGISHKDKCKYTENNIEGNELSSRSIDSKIVEDAEECCGLNSDADWDLLEKFSGI